jgi:FAD:protein FMN transferase
MNYRYSQNKNSILIFFNSAVTFLLLFFIAGEIHPQDSIPVFEMSAKKYLMGTEFEITAIHPSVDTCKRAMYLAFREIERIEKVTSNYKDSTEISYVNRNAFLSPVKMSPELFGIIERSIKYSAMFDGFFDVSVGPLTDYWGFNSEHPLETEPDSSKIKSLLGFVNYKFIKLSTADSTIQFLKQGVKIDLGGIAKGYALDRAVDVLRKSGVNNFLISGGGDIFASGHKPNDAKWTVGVKDPRNNENLVAKLEVENTGVITSGDYERYRIINGIRYHHIFNPKNGFPANLSQSATVIYNECERGVVLSKILFILRADSNDYFNGIPYYLINQKGNVNYNTLIKPYLVISK